MFTITEGLENLGALKTGGQGSVYKGRRMGAIHTAIKLLPTPIYSETEEDKNYRDFMNEVEKLKKVNEHPNPNVVKIMGSGVTDTGNFPFIEMEFIEGPDLEELLKPPHPGIFSIKEVIKVAEHLSHALAHCHSVNVKHGDIKSNNVKLNIHTGNYVLLDFGLAVMSDEQRRTSLRHAGAIEFMAPEQNEGRTLFETDVYSFGVIIFELIAGTVPFPLKEKGETARNKVMLSHLELPPPDLLPLRREHLPSEWSQSKRDLEMHIPGWLVSMIYKCLEKKPGDRFANGMDLHDYVLLNSSMESRKQESSSDMVVNLRKENERLAAEARVLQENLSKQQRLLTELNAAHLQKDDEIRSLRERIVLLHQKPSRQGVSTPVFYALLLVTALLTAFAAYSLISGRMLSDHDGSPETLSRLPADTQSYSAQVPDIQDTSVSTAVKPVPERKQKDTVPALENAPPQTDPMDFDTARTVGVRNETQEQGKPPIARYKIGSKAFFHDEPDESTRRNAYIIPVDGEVLEALEEKNGFIYVVYTNSEGKTSKGWILKTALVLLDE